MAQTIVFIAIAIALNELPRWLALADLGRCTYDIEERGRQYVGYQNYLTTVSEYAREAVCCGLLASRTVTVRLNVPETVGVPKSAPTELIFMPLGWPETDQL